MSEMVETQLSAIPILPLRDVVVYPHMVIPLFVGREKSIQALEAAMDNGKQILLVAQKSAAKDEPTQEDLYEIGTVPVFYNYLNCLMVRLKFLLKVISVRALLITLVRKSILLHRLKSLMRKWLMNVSQKYWCAH